MVNSDNVRIRAEDLCRRCERQYTAQFTGFLTPEEQAEVKFVSHSYTEVLTVFIGGVKNAERRIAGFFPKDLYACPENDDDMKEYAEMAEIKYLQISGSGFVNIGHRDVLGSLMSLGIKRETLGDIIIAPDNKTAYIPVLSGVVTYICDSLDRVARDKVKVTVVKPEIVPERVQRFSDMSVTLASVRIDALVSAITGTARDKVKKLIVAGKVSINHSDVFNCDSEFAEGDIVTVKGEGKYLIEAFLGVSAKNRCRVIVRKYL